mmetsp:Transcript_331/g.791  ORF Transcript_331/g.791 Transcript_331/m.791 type:complete len:244 (+) Transcript_331:69-800(+)
MARTRNVTKKSESNTDDDTVESGTDDHLCGGAPLEGLDGRNRESVETLIQDITDEVNRRIGVVRRDARNFSIRLQSDMKCELLKMPSSMRKMSIKDFNKKFGGDVRLVVPSNKQLRPLGMKRERPGGNYNEHMVMETPLRPVTTSTKIMSSRRAPRQGEILLSANGSPVNNQYNEMFATIKKRKANPPVGIIPNSFVEVNVDMSIMENLPSEAKEHAWMQLKNVTDELNIIMKKIKEEDESSS